MLFIFKGFLLKKKNIGNNTLFIFCTLRHCRFILTADLSNAHKYHLNKLLAHKTVKTKTEIQNICIF